MAQERIVILINGQEVDFQRIESLPLKLKKETDDFLNVVGAKGLSVDRIANQLVFPATKRNEEIFSQIQRGDILDNTALGIAEVEIIIQSQSAYFGDGLVRIITQRGQYPQTFGIEILGDAFDIFPQLENTNLCQLDLGIVRTNKAAIIDTWTNINRPYVSAPITYGSAGRDERFPNGFAGGREIDRPFWQFRVSDMRPHVKIWKIFEAIFETYLGYSIDSRMYESEFFRRLTHSFGVGDQWKRADNYEIYKFRATGGAQTIVKLLPWVSVFDIQFPTTVYDTSPLGILWINDDTFNTNGAPDGWYKFRIVIRSPDVEAKFAIVLQTLTNASGAFTLTSETLEEINANEVFESDPIYFESFDGVTYLKVQVELEDQFDSVYISGCEIEGELLDIGAMGHPVHLATCLPCESLKSFILGVMHSCGLVLKANRITRQIFFECRFYNPTQLAAQGFPIPNAWYKNPQLDSNNKFLSDIDTSQEKIIERPIYPFGDTLILGYKKSNDPLFEYYEDNLKEQELSLGDVRFSFRQTGKKGKEIRNPYFEEMINLKYNYPDTYSNILTELGAILDSVPSFDFEDHYILPDRKFEANPKLLYYHGLIVFSQVGVPGFMVWKFNGNLTAPYDFEIPCLYTRFPDWSSDWQLPTGEPRVNLTYSTLGYNGQGAVDIILPTPAGGTPLFGFVRRFYLEYLSIINEGRKVELEVLTNYDEFDAEDFRNIKSFSKFRENNQILVYKIDSFEPLKGRTAKLFGLVVAWPTQETLDAIEENFDKYIFERKVKSNI